MTFVLGRFSRFIEYRWLVGLWLGGASLCDVVIVYMLSNALMTQRTGFGRTDALINKLLWYTINTGLLTSIFAIVDLICFCTMNNLIHFGFNMALGKLYTNTLLATLNARDIEPTNVVHVEEESYNLKERSQNSSNGQVKFNRPPGISSNQGRGEPAILLQTDSVVKVSNVEPHRRSSRDQVVGCRALLLVPVASRLMSPDLKYQGHQVIVIQHDNHATYTSNKDTELDADGADSVESFKKGRA
ncbi:hypothetical protein RHS03_09799, partial [Rhizoctonia solani]